MYKILILRRAGIETYWSMYQEASTPDPMVKEDYVTDDLTELEEKIKDLLLTIPKNNIKPITDMEFLIEVIVN